MKKMVKKKANIPVFIDCIEISQKDKHVISYCINCIRKINPNPNIKASSRHAKKYERD